MPKPDEKEAAFRLGAWRVHPDRCEIENAQGARKLEPMAMRLLLLLAANESRTTTRDEIVEALWDGRVVTEDAINKQVSRLRSAFGDSATQAHIIQTVPKIGFRLIPPVTRLEMDADQNRKRSQGRRTILAVMTGLALIALAFFLIRDPGVNITQEPATSIPGSEIDPSLSPDGEWLSFAARATENDLFALYVKRLGDEEARRLTPPDVSARSPAWSPDGRIAFVTDKNGVCSINIGLPSGSFRPVASCVAAYVGGLSWLDADRLVIADRPGLGRSFQLDLLDVRSGARTILVSPPAGDVGDLAPLVSPDRKKVYFQRSKSVGPSEIYVTIVGTGETRKVTADGAVINGMALGPDGTLLVSSNRGENGFSLWKLDPERQHWQRMMPGPMPDLSSTIDGRLIVYMQVDRRISLWQLPLSGTGGRYIAPSTQVDWSPVLSSGQRYLAFLSDRSGNREIWILDLSTKAVRRLTSFDGPEIQDVAWSPDGALIATSVPSGGQFDIHLIDTRTGSGSIIARTSADERMPAFRPDGKGLWLVRRTGTRFSLVEHDFASKRETLILNNVMRALPSSDGRLVFYSLPFTDGVWMANLQTKEKRQLTSWPNIGRMRDFTLTSEGLWAVATNENGEETLMLTDLSSGKSRSILSLPDISRPSGIAILNNSVIHARLLREESDLTLLRLN